MRVLVIGASGYLGSAVADRLSEKGHQVVAFARPDDVSNVSRYEQRVGDLHVPATLSSAVTVDIDAVIHAATPTGDAAADAAAIDALTGPLRGTYRPFVYTSGVWVLGATGEAGADEDSPTNPIPIVGYRPDIEQQVLATTDAGVRSSVIRPGIIHGRGGGIPALMVDWARKDGAPRIVGDESVRWPMVHVDDLADLFVTVVEQGPAGAVWHGISESAVPVYDLAVAAGQAAGAPGEPRVWPLEKARDELGELFADALALDQTVSGRNAYEKLGWRPRHLDAVSDLRDGSYY